MKNLKIYATHILSVGILRLAVILAILIVTVVSGLTFLVYSGLFGPIPDYEELRNIRHYKTSAIYSSDGAILGQYYLQNRDPVELEDVSDDFINALLAIEDIRFYEHNGLDYRALARVLVRTLLLRQNAGGGSTLTQQLAKNLYPRHGAWRISLPAEKIREIIIAHRIEKLYAKQEILELYINTVSFGEDTWGIKTATDRFFNTSPDRLKLHQSATLAGMLRATTWYNPRRNPDHALQRRNIVLHQMEMYGMITPEILAYASGQPLDLDYHRSSHSDESAPHFREFLRSRLQQILASIPDKNGKKYNLYTDGLVIETTIDSRMQNAARQAVAMHLPKLQARFDDFRNHEPVFAKDDPQVYRDWYQSEYYRMLKNQGHTDDKIMEIFDKPVPMNLFMHNGADLVNTSPRDSIRHYLSLLNTGFLAMNAANGDILAWVGSIDHNYFQYDHVRTKRQTGSAFKPIVYAAALEAGIKPCDYRRNMLSTYARYDNWTPANLKEEYGGHYSIQGALSSSINTIAIDLLMETGIEKVRQTARLMGIQSPIPSQPSIALGSAGLTLMEMITAYSTFVNQGTPLTPRYINRIFDSEGVLIYDAIKMSYYPDQAVSNKSHSPSSTQSIAPVSNINSGQQSDESTFMSGNKPLATQTPAFSEETAGAMLAMLSRSVNNGSGQALRSQFGIQHALAGKTGTTQNHADGWFIGITPHMVFGSWIGGATPAVHLPEHIGYASQTALPVAGHFLRILEQSETLPPTPNQFYSHQQSSTFDTNCEDFRKERFIDRVKDRLHGRDSREAQVVGDEDNDTSIISRVRSWFGKK